MTDMMKRVMMVALLWVGMVMAVQGQRLNVDVMRLDPTDLSGLAMKRLDANGETAALIKVSVLAPNPVFSGNLVGKVNKQEGYYWVYLTAVNPASQDLRIATDGYHPIQVKFSDYGISSLAPGATYILELSNAEIESQDNIAIAHQKFAENYNEDDIQLQNITINVNPPDSKVEIDGALFPVLNGIVATLLPVGNHKVTVFNECYSKTEQIKLSSSPKEVTINLNMDSSNKAILLNENNCLTNEDEAYNTAVQYLKEGDDKEAKNVAIEAIKKGYGSCHEILRALLCLGYYDNNKTEYDKVKAIIDKWDKSQSSEFYESIKEESKDSVPQFGIQ